MASYSGAFSVITFTLFARCAFEGPAYEIAETVAAECVLS